MRSVVLMDTHPLDGLITPSRDVWETLVRSEVEDILGQPGYSRAEMVEELMVLVRREQGRKVAEER